MEHEKFGTGAIISDSDNRTVEHSDDTFAGVPLIRGGIDYSATDIENQHAVGICTAISRVQMKEKQTGKRYSPDFQYLLQKKYYDINWTEGSSVLTANKVAKKYGFLPLNLFTYVTENDRFNSYDKYIAKLEAIPESEIQRLIGLCVDPIAGYALVDVSDPQKIAQAIMASPKQTGILCRYGCQKNWWTSITGIVSWLAKDINPLRNGPETSGHAIINSKFDYTNASMQRLANTWGWQWCINGSADINWDNYKMNEAWVDLETAPVIINKYVFTQTLRQGSKGNEVRELQKILNITVDGSFGPMTKKTVIIFQLAHSLVGDGIVGAKTRAILNA